MNSYRKGPVGSVILPHFSGFTTSASKLGSQSGSGFVPGVHLVNTNTKHSYILFSLSERVDSKITKDITRRNPKDRKIDMLELTSHLHRLWSASCSQSHYYFLPQCHLV